MSSERTRRLLIALGKKGSGKTGGVIRPLLQRYLAAGGDVRILDPSGQFGELGEWPGREAARDGSWIDELTATGQGPAEGGWGPGLLILDDADRYLGPGRGSGWDDVWMANRHVCLDVAISAHRPQGIPKEAIAAADELWLFEMDEVNALEYLSKIPALAPSFENNAHPLPGKPGLALRVLPSAKQVHLVELF